VLLIAAAGMAGSRSPATAESHYWELGAGYYQGIGSENPTDEARWDWAVLSESNTPVTADWIRGHLNKNLELNPKQKYMVELCPLNHLGNPARYAQQATFLEFHFKPEVRAEILKRLQDTIEMILTNISKPENVYGFSMLEEVPGNFGAADQIAWAKDPDQLPPILEEFRADLEKERGKPLVWDDDTRLWVGQTFAQAMEQIHRTMKEAMGPGHKVVYWHHGGYTYLDERGELGSLPANAPLKSGSLYPCKWSDIVKPGLVDALMGWPEHPERFQRTLRLAERFNLPFFFQLSHPSVMRLNSWADCLKNAKTKHPLNLGYFFFCEGDCNRGQWNDDPSFSAAPGENVLYASIPDHVRRFCAQENVGTPVMEAYMRPRVALFSNLGTAQAGAILPVDVLLHNPATPQFYRNPDDATAREVEVALTVPPGCRIQASYSIPPVIKIGDLKPDEYRIVEWWVTVDKPPAGGKYETAVSVKCANRPAVSERYVGDSAVPAFQPQEIRRSGYRWAENAIGEPAVRPWVTMEALLEPVKGPAISDGLVTLIYQGALSPGRRLVVSPQGQARLVNWYLMPRTDVGKPDANDLSGYAPFTEEYTVAGRYLGQPLGDVKRIKVTVAGKVAEGARSLVIVAFATDTGSKDVACLGGFGEQWQEMSEEVAVPEGALRLERIYFFRGEKKGKVWYGPASIMAADLPPEGRDVTAATVGSTPTVPGGSFRVLTYTDQELLTLRPKIRVQLWKEEPK
jgi:hypothetical protein